MADNDSSDSDGRLKDFYEVEKAADTAADWPLLQMLWHRLGGSDRSSSGTRLTSRAHGFEATAKVSETAAEATTNGHHIESPADPGAAPRHDHTRPAQSLEELFGRMR